MGIDKRSWLRERKIASQTAEEFQRWEALEKEELRHARTQFFIGVVLILLAIATAAVVVAFGRLT
jgi:hypothetical protein